MYNSIPSKKILDLSVDGGTECTSPLHHKAILSLHSKRENLNFDLKQLPLNCTINILKKSHFRITSTLSDRTQIRKTNTAFLCTLPW